MTTDKPKFSMYWASACGGCDIAVLGIHEQLLDLADAVEPVFWPCLTDGKRRDVEALSDGELALTLFNGAIRTSEDEEMARLLRSKSRILVAFGSCAVEGCVPALSNLSTAGEHLRTIYLDNVGTLNPGKVTPGTRSRVDEGEPDLPVFYDTVKSLRQTVEVDYSIPGCPPESTHLWDIIQSLLGGEPPKKCAVLGAGEKALCEECPRTRGEKRIKKLYRLHEIIPNQTDCLIDQGLLCMGPATRSGCSALCPKANMPCSGCYGPPPGVVDQGAAMLSALASVIDTWVAGKSEARIREDIGAALESLVDPAGAFYKFSLAHSLLGRARRHNMERYEKDQH